MLRVAAPFHAKVDFTFHVLIHCIFTLELVKCIHSFNRNTFLPPNATDWLDSSHLKCELKMECLEKTVPVSKSLSDTRNTDCPGKEVKLMG